MPNHAMPSTLRLLSVFLVLCVLSLVGCRTETRADRIARGEVVINIGAEPTSLDPGQLTDLQGARAMYQFMRGLTYMDKDGSPRPELAESWTISPDGLVYTFKLREAVWSNGLPITAADYVYAWRRVLNPAFGSQYAYQLFYIKGARDFYEGKTSGVETIGARALAPDTLEVTVENVTPFFLQLVSHQTYFPICAEVDRNLPEWFHRPETYACSGPFTIVEHVTGSHLVLEKNPRYWNAGAVKMNRITFRMIEQESTERIAYDNGEIDGTNMVPRQEIHLLKGRPDFHQSPQTGTYFINLNCQKPPFNDVRVRRALAMAIDREALVESVMRAGERPAYWLAPPELYDNNPPPATFQDKNYDEARRLLAEAGFTRENPPGPFGYLYNTLEGHRLVALTLQETWRKELGIDLKLENQEWKVQVERRHSGDYEISRAGWYADFPDAINFLEMYDSQSENNDPKFHDPQYDAMLAAIRAEQDSSRRMQMMRDAETYLMNQMPIIPLYYYTQNYLVAPALRGYELGILGIFDGVDLEWLPPAP